MAERPVCGPRDAEEGPPQGPQSRLSEKRLRIVENSYINEQERSVMRRACHSAHRAVRPVQKAICPCHTRSLILSPQLISEAEVILTVETLTGLREKVSQVPPAHRGSGEQSLWTHHSAPQREREMMTGGAVCRQGVPRVLYRVLYTTVRYTPGYCRDIHHPGNLRDIHHPGNLRDIPPG